MSDLSKEFKFYLANQTDLVSRYAGKFIVVKDEKVIGIFDTELKAVIETRKMHEPGTFLVQEVAPGQKGHTQTFHSRVVFA